MSRKPRLDSIRGGASGIAVCSTRAKAVSSDDQAAGPAVLRRRPAQPAPGQEGQGDREVHDHVVPVGRLEDVRPLQRPVLQGLLVRQVHQPLDVPDLPGVGDRQVVVTGDREPGQPVAHEQRDQQDDLAAAAPAGSRPGSVGGDPGGPRSPTPTVTALHRTCPGCPRNTDSCSGSCRPNRRPGSGHLVDGPRRRPRGRPRPAGPGRGAAPGRPSQPSSAVADHR